MASIPRPNAAHRPAATPRPLRPALEAGCDHSVILLAGMLVTLGVVMVFSASMSVTGEVLDFGRWWATPLRQGVFAALGLAAMLITAQLDPRMFAWNDGQSGLWPIGLYLLTAALLVVVLIPGIGLEQYGARRAIGVGGGGMSLTFQPSELAKVALSVWLAALLTSPGFDIRHLRRGFIPALVSAGLLVVLTAVEDFGTAALLGSVMMLILWHAGARYRHLIGTTIVGAGGAFIYVFTSPFRWRRVMAFFSDEPDLSGDSYQVTQSLIAIGSGSWWGRGLGAGVQKYGYLPKDHNDFIFAIVCEELGVIGGIAVITLFLALLWRGVRLAAQTKSPFARLLATGLTLTIGLQAAFNIAVVTDCVPTKGISLPFVSAGGSGVVILGMAAGLLASVARVANPQLRGNSLHRAAGEP